MAFILMTLTTLLKWILWVMLWPVHSLWLVIFISLLLDIGYFSGLSYCFRLRSAIQHAIYCLETSALAERAYILIILCPGSELCSFHCIYVLLLSIRLRIMRGGEGRESVQMLQSESCYIVSEYIVILAICICSRLLFLLLTKPCSEPHQRLS